MDNSNKTGTTADSAILKQAMRELNIACKTLNVSTATGTVDQVQDIEFWGDVETFKLISKASSRSEGWMKSTKAMQSGSGCVVQVTTQQRNPDGSYALAEAVTFVPNVFIVDMFGDGEEVISRKLVENKRIK